MKPLSNLSDYQIILASNSPRRRELLGGLGIDFSVRVLEGIDESFPSDLQGEEIPLYISQSKAEAYLPSLAENELLITADTIVYVDLEDGHHEVLGKPRDAADAAAMLRMLSGRKHRVITGVCVASQQRREVFAATTWVEFASLSDVEIDHYVSTFQPFDKAGAYGIQEWIGYIGVTGLEGSYFNVVGLPVQRLYQVLKRW